MRCRGAHDGTAGYLPHSRNLIPNPDSQEDSDSYSQERPGADLTETFQIREYVPGDSMRQIHWKLSGKFDRLIVRDPALPITRNVLVFWERTGSPEVSNALTRRRKRWCQRAGACRTAASSSPSDGTIRTAMSASCMRFAAWKIWWVLSPGCCAPPEGRMVSAARRCWYRPGRMPCADIWCTSGEEPCADVLQMQRLGHVTALLCGESPLEEHPLRRGAVSGTTGRN